MAVRRLLTCFRYESELADCRRISKRLLHCLRWLLPRAEVNPHGGRLYNAHFCCASIGQQGSPVIVAAINYRNGIMGFLGGKEVAESGNQNLGLRDQATALAWLKMHASAFGGDASKITVFGESGGAVSISYHLLAQGTVGSLRFCIASLLNALQGFEPPSFRAAIMQSGSAGSGYVKGDVKGTQPTFDYVVQKLKCARPSSVPSGPLESQAAVPPPATASIASAGLDLKTSICPASLPHWLSLYRLSSPASPFTKAFAHR
jgi:hypothetical protein